MTRSKPKASSETSEEVFDELLIFDSSYSDKATHILAAAIQLFARKGYRTTSVRDIVELADVTNPMLYYYFDDKKGIFRAAANLIFSDYNKWLGEILEDDELAFQKKIYRVVEKHLTTSRETPVAVKFIYSIFLSPADSMPEFDLHEGSQSREEKLARIFEEARQSGEINVAEDMEGAFFAEQLFGIVGGHLQKTLSIWQAAETKKKSDEILKKRFSTEYAERLTDFILRGAGIVDHT